MTALTPRRLFARRGTLRHFSAVAAQCWRLSSDSVTVRPFYSIKTNPRIEILKIARTTGFGAEAISPDEVAAATSAGFGAEDIIYNGPVRLRDRAVAYAFADSAEAFARYRCSESIATAGIRLRPAMLTRSRFGVPVEDDGLLVRHLETHPSPSLAFSFHARRGDFEGASWRDVALDVVTRAQRIAGLAGATVTALDVGGGWTPEEFERDFVRDMEWLLDRIGRMLPAVKTVMLEPGQAVATRAEALLATVIELRQRTGRREAIIDVGYPEWPLMHAYVHPLFVRTQGRRWRRLPPGADRIGGRTCLEYDVIEGIALPPDVREGDRLLIAGCGSYDHSMAYPFARGASAA